jgi:urease accessory protein|tara:strand:- start:19391 stop:20269 length:879 start_codon:yes stop_codon:yes gene_type:complete
MVAVLKLDQRSDLQLQFSLAPAGQTYINHQYSHYPFHICRAQYVDSRPSGLATIYLQSSAGGIFANDRLSCEFDTMPESQAHITTQSSTIVHRMDQGDAHHSVIIRAEENSLLEYMPDPMILFPMAKMHSSVLVQMHPTATVIMADAFTSHDPLANQQMANQEMTNEEYFSEFQSETRVENFDGVLMCLDRYRVSGTQFCSGQLGVMGKNKIQGTFMLLNSTHPVGELCNLLRAYLESNFVGYSGVSHLPNDCGIWVRLVAIDAFSLRSAILELWAMTRNALVGSRPCQRKK